MKQTFISALVVMLAAVSMPTAAVSAQSDDEWQSLSELGFDTPTQRQIDRAIERYSVRSRSVIRYRVVDRSVRPIETVETDGDETVVNLSSDILFDFDKAELTADAVTHIGELVADVPQGASVSVFGHTDSVGDDAYNLDLSARRAQAVADAISASRSDLVIDVQGLGETQPKKAESGDDIAEDQAANRRVEIRYET